MYYLRTMATSSPIQLTVDQATVQQDDTAVTTKPVKKRPIQPVLVSMIKEKKPHNGLITSFNEEESDDQRPGKLTVVENRSPNTTPKRTSDIAKKEEIDKA